MKYQFTLLALFWVFVVNAQTNSFPLYSNGNSSGGSGDYTNLVSPQLKLQSTTSYPRVAHISSASGISVVYNFETGKNAYWGEPSDAGQYLFRGRDMIVEEGKLGIGLNSPTQKLSVNGQGVFLTSGVSDDPGDATGPAIRIGFTSDYGYITANNTGVWPRNLALQRNGGNVGIGTSSPTAKLEINQSGGMSGQNQALKVWAGNTNTYFGNSQIVFNYGGGTGAYSHTIKTRHNSSSIDGNAFDFYVWQPGDPVNGEGSLNVMTLNGDKVGIGTSNPDQKLTVNGTIHSKEVKVDLSVPAPDYVFEKEYKLPSLEEIKIYIDQNKHLPEVPSAKEMETNGVLLGEMNMLLLKKIEELTLHMIELKTENEIMKVQIEKINEANR